MNIKQTLVVRTLLLTVLTTLMASCGSGDSDDDNNTAPSGDNTIASGIVTPNPSAAYTGSRDPMLLDENNTLKLTTFIYGSSDTSNLLSRPDSTATEQSLVNALSLTSSLTRMVGNNPSNSLAARTVSESEACEYGGTISLNGEVDDATSTGTVIYQASNCQEVKGEVINGQMYAIIHSDSSPYSETIGFNNLSLTQNGNTLLQTGTINNIIGSNSDGEYQDQTINLFSSNSATGEQSFLENFRILAGTAYNDATNPAQMSGKIYISGEGYATASGSDDLVLSSEATPQSGHIMLLGASASQARISQPSDEQVGYGVFRVDLDEDGDGFFESKALESITSGSSLGFSANQSPTAVLQASEYDYFFPGSGDTSHPVIYQGDTVYLFGSQSVDPDGDVITYQWTVESAPAGSTALFLEADTSVDNIFIPDIAGVYKISLKVTDTNGSGTSSLAFFDFDTTNIAPEISFPESFYYADDPQINAPFEAGYELWIAVDIVDTDTTASSDRSITYSYELIEKPTGSNGSVRDTIYYDGNTLSGSGQKFTGLLQLTTDLAGTYKISLTATDHGGLTSTETIVVDVVNTPPTVILTCDTCSNGNVMNSDELYTLRVTDSYDHAPGFGHYRDINFDWSISSDVTDATGAPFAIEEAEDTNIYYFSAPISLGEYKFTVTATDKGGQVATLEKTFLVQQNF